MPVPPPPPPPPPSAVQVPIPKSNKNLLQSIEKGTKLRKVPESAKNDRSSGVAGAKVGPTSNCNNNVAKTNSQKLGENVSLRPASNNSSNDLQSQLKSQFSSTKPINNGVQDRKTSVPLDRFTSLRPPSSQISNRELPITKSYTPVNSPPQKVIKQQPEVLLATRMSPQSYIPSDSNRTPQLNQQLMIRNKAAPPMPVNNKPLVSKFSQNSLATINRPQSTTHATTPVVATPQPKPFVANYSRSPAPNQPLQNGARAPPPPPSKSKPLTRNSISMDHIVPVSSTLAFNEHLVRPKVQQPREVMSPQSSVVTRTTANPPPPVPSPFRPNFMRPTSVVLAPPVPSRVGVQAPPCAPVVTLPQRFSIPASVSTAMPYKVADRAPPPPPPGGMRVSNVTKFSAFDRRFTFPDEGLFPRP